MTRVNLSSPYPLSECQRLLDWALKQSDTVIGSIDGTRMVARRRISYRNSFQTRLIAILADEGGQTHIRCRFGLHPIVVAFLAVWFSFVLLAGGGGIIGAIVGFAIGSPDAAGHLAGFLIPGAMLLFGAILVIIGRLIASGEREALTVFVIETLAASRCKPGDRADRKARFASGLPSPH